MCVLASQAKSMPSSSSKICRKRSCRTRDSKLRMWESLLSTETTSLRWWLRGSCLWRPSLMSDQVHSKATRLKMLRRSNEFSERRNSVAVSIKVNPLTMTKTWIMLICCSDEQDVDELPCDADSWLSKDRPWRQYACQWVLATFILPKRWAHAPGPCWVKVELKGTCNFTR